MGIAHSRSKRHFAGRPFRPWRLLAAAAALALPLTAAAQVAAPGTAGDRLVAMTLNQYLGSDLSPLLEARNPVEFNAHVVGLLRQIAATDFPARARRQAKAIATHAPDLVGLQEVWRLACRDLGPSEPGKGCADPTIAGAFTDHLAVTLRALGRRGAPYRVAGVVRNFDTAEIAVPAPGGGVVHGLPFTVDGRHQSLLLAVDRDVILARAGVATRLVKFPGCRESRGGCSYRAALTVPVPALGGTAVTIERGFVGVDAVVRGRPYRFVTTHLEVDRFPQAQSLQAAELIWALGSAPPARGPVVLVGDMNSSRAQRPVSPALPTPYRRLARAGYVDSWLQAPGAGPGFTCCQDNDLANVDSALSERIDLILSRRVPVAVRDAEVVGDEPEDKTPPTATRPALWPSDHGGVSAALRF